MNGDFLVLQYLDITLDCHAPEHDHIIVEELHMANLEDKSLVCHKELQDGSAFLILWRKVHVLHILHYVAVLAVQANTLGIHRCTVEKLPLHVTDPLLYARYS
jgi:hypothetical protein